MNDKTKRSWAIISFLAITGSTMTVVAQPRDRQDAARTESRDAGEQSRTVRYDDLPREVRKTLDEERGGREVVGVQQVNQGGKEFYRCTVALKKGERSIRIQPGGNLLSVEDVSEADVAAYRQKGSPDEYYRQRDSQVSSRQAYWDQVNARVTATAKNPEKVNSDDIPARVRATFAREAMGAKVDYVVRYRQGNDVIYQTNIPDGRDKVRMLQVTSDGRLVNSGEFTNGGRPADADASIRTLDVADLPSRVRETLDKDYARIRISHVDVATRGGGRIYNIEFDDGNHDRFLVVNEQGRVLSDISGRDYGRDEHK